MDSNSASALMALVLVATGAHASAATTLLFDDFSYTTESELATGGWSIAETGDLQMVYQLTGGTININNESTGGANNQSIAFVRDIDTTGYQDISIALQWRANGLDDFELSDFIRLVVYDGGFPSEANRTIPWTTEGLWVPGVNPATTTTTTNVDLGSFASENPDLQIGFEVNTSLDREVIIIDSITIAGSAVPEPSTLAFTSTMLCALALRRRRR